MCSAFIIVRDSRINIDRYREYTRKRLRSTSGGHWSRAGRKRLSLVRLPEEDKDKAARGAEKRVASRRREER